MPHHLLQRHLQKAVSLVLPDARLESILVRVCPNPKFGDYQCSAIIALAKQSGLGRKAEAVQASLQLRERADLLPSARNGWYHRLLDYHCDLLNAHDLLKQAGPSRWNQSEAHFRIGLTRLAEGDRRGACEHFHQTVALGIYMSFDYDWSKAFLARLEKNPNWPPWIPVKPAP